MGRPEAADNFLVPNATFFVELIAFVLILWILGKYVVAADQRRAQPTGRRRSEASSRRPRRPRPTHDEAEEKYNAPFVEARHEAARIREEAREQGAAIVAEMREQAQAEADRIVAHAHAQLEAERQQVVSQLRDRGRQHRHRPGRDDRR